jgi:hypothetical protein
MRGGVQIFRLEIQNFVELAEVKSVWELQEIGDQEEDES